MTQLNSEPPYDDIFQSWSLTIVNSPNPRVDEQNIRSGARNIWELVYVKHDGTRHGTIFKLEIDAREYLRNLVLHLRYPRPDSPDWIQRDNIKSEDRKTDGCTAGRGMNVLSLGDRAARAEAEAEKLARRAAQYPDAPQVAMWVKRAATSRAISARHRVDLALLTGRLDSAHRIILGSTGRAYADFAQSDRVGKLGEYSFMAHLQATGSVILEGPRDGYFPAYDLKAVRDGRAYTVEVKTDLTLSENCYAEWGEGGRPSGVTSTEADYFVIYRAHLGQFYVASTASLMAWAEDQARRGNLYRTQNRRSGRDTWGYLIPHARWVEIPGAKVISWRPEA